MNKLNTLLAPIYQVSLSLTAFTGLLVNEPVYSQKITKAVREQIFHINNFVNQSVKY